MSKPGRRVSKPMRGTSERQRMWNCICQLRSFTQPDLVATAEVDKQHVSKYVCKLLRAGYLREVKAPTRTIPKIPGIYQLLRDTGPHAPRFGEDGSVRDANLEPQHLPREAQPVLVPRGEYERALRCVRACAGMQDPEAEIARLRALAEAVA